jgi:hypothetical protein
MNYSMNNSNSVAGFWPSYDNCYNGKFSFRNRRPKSIEGIVLRFFSLNFLHQAAQFSSLLDM